MDHSSSTVTHLPTSALLPTTTIREVVQRFCLRALAVECGVHHTCGARGRGCQHEAIARNKRLRESIDSLRRERLVFDQIYAKLEREMAEKNREMARNALASNRASVALSNPFPPQLPPASPSLSPSPSQPSLPP